MTSRSLFVTVSVILGSLLAASAALDLAFHVNGRLHKYGWVQKNLTWNEDAVRSSPSP